RSNPPSLPHLTWGPEYLAEKDAQYAAPQVLSPGGAQDDSPRRQPWVEAVRRMFNFGLSPGGAEDSSAPPGLPPFSRRPYPRLAPWAIFLRPSGAVISSPTPTRSAPSPCPRPGVGRTL